MSIQLNKLSPCHYLFNKGAEELFSEKESPLVNRSLENVMQVVDHLLNFHPESLFIFDPSSHNNQCHLYALMVVETVQMSKIQSIAFKKLQESVGQPLPDPVKRVIGDYLAPVDRRFFVYSFLLSFVLENPTLMEKVVTKALVAMKREKPDKAFIRFLKDSQFIKRTKEAARDSLNRLFFDHMKRELAQGVGVFSAELVKLAAENLQLAAQPRFKPYYTLPKFAGVIFLTDLLAKEKIHPIFKVKVVTKEGVGSFTYPPVVLTEENKKSPTLVFEMIAAGKELTFSKCSEMAKGCPKHTGHIKSEVIRQKDKPCYFCGPKNVDAAPFKDRLKPTFERLNEMLLAAGADFVNEEQKAFLPLFSDPQKYPKLTRLFEESLAHIKLLSISSKEPLNMSVMHVHTDTLEEASKEVLIMDGSYEDHLRSRGLL